MTMVKNIERQPLSNHSKPSLVAPSAANGQKAPAVAPIAAEAAPSASSSLFARQVRMAYGLLQTAIEEAGDTVEIQNVKIASELEELQAKALRSIHESALATIDLIEAIRAAQTPGELASRQIALARRQGETVNDRLVDFFASARSMAAVMADPLNRQMRALSGAIATERGPAEAGDSVLVRLNKLTARQKKVLELLAEGLPNKVIAHELGISETTVKAHVGEILRKLKVYNRARAIVMLAQYDMRQIRDLPATEGPDGD
jgi:DNA-binding NarL/FixJ family response regulator